MGDYLSRSKRRGLIVEGKHDLIAYDCLLRKMGYIPKVRQTHGNGNLIKKIHAWVGLLKQYNCAKIIALKDLNFKSKEELQEECSNFPNDVPLCTASKTLEAWMVADENALKRQFRNPRVKTIPNPEKLDKPYEILKNIYRENGKKYIALKELPKIIDEIDLDVLRSKCPSFSDFENALA